MSEIKVFAVHKHGALIEEYPVLAKDYDSAVIDYTVDSAATPEQCNVELVEYMPVSTKLKALLEAVKAILARWESTDWKDAPTATHMNAMRDALTAFEGGDK